METWTAEDDAILVTRARVKRVADALRPASMQEETVDATGTISEFHDPGPWGVCGTVASRVNDSEVVVRASIGDRVRDGEDNARELELTLEACNQWFEWEGRPFAYVRDGDDVFLEAHLRRDDITEEELFWVVRDFEGELDRVPAVVEAHMESLHYPGEDDCVCPPCLNHLRSTMTSESLQAHLGHRDEWADLNLALDPLVELARLG